MSWSRPTDQGHEDPNEERIVKVTKFLAVATVIILSSASSATRADDCDDIVNAIKKVGEAVMKKDAKTPPAICAGMGQALGLMQSTRIVAEECYDEGKKRDDLMKDMAESAKVFQDEIDSMCK